MFLLDSLKGTDIEIDIIGSGTLKNNLIKYAKQNNIKLNIFENVPNSELLNILKNYKFLSSPLYMKAIQKVYLKQSQSDV